MSPFARAKASRRAQRSQCEPTARSWRSASTPITITNPTISTSTIGGPDPGVVARLTITPPVISTKTITTGIMTMIVSTWLIDRLAHARPCARAASR